MITPADTPPERPGQMPSSAFPIVAPYEPGVPSPILAHGDADAGGRDNVSGTVAGSVVAAEARLAELQSDPGQGGTIGDLMQMPPNPLDPAASSPGTTDPSGSFYDPPRSY